MSQHNIIEEPKVSLKLNISERFISVVAGSLLVANSLRRKRFSALQAVAGGFLLYKGLKEYPHRDDDAHYVKTHPRNINIKSQVTVQQPVHEVYAFWRNLENLPIFMKHLKKVSPVNEHHREWYFTGSGLPGLLEWKSEIVKEEKNHLLGWQSVPGSSIENAGKIVFEAKENNSTEIHIVISYKAPLGKAGEKIAHWINPFLETMIKEDIEGYKTYVESQVSPHHQFVSKRLTGL